MFTDLLSSITVPPLQKILYRPPLPQSVDAASELSTQLDSSHLLSRDCQGKTVAMTCGSRDITDIVPVLRTLADKLHAVGAHPFIVPAMGSHGGATAEGQLEILNSLGVTEASVHAPIYSSMDTEFIAFTPEHLPVYMDKHALHADYIIPVGRIKPHTEFHGDIESGILKMIAVGLGKQKGASVVHSLGPQNLSKTIISIASTALAHVSVPLGIGIIENRLHQTHSIHVVPASQIVEREKALLLLAKEQLPRIPFENLDVLAVYEMGKDISGTGMDSNVTGRSLYLPPSRPYAKILSVLRLTEKSHHNANGIGCADVTTQKLVDAMNPKDTFPNAITSADPKGCKIPVYMPNDLQALQLAVLFSQNTGLLCRFLLIKNTLQLDRMYASPALLSGQALPPFCSVSPNENAFFNTEGNLYEDIWESSHSSSPL